MLAPTIALAFAIAAAVVQDEPATLAAIVQQMSSLQQRVALVEAVNADLRLAKRQGPTDAQFGVTSLGQPRQLSESPDTCCRWTPGETCQTTERVCSMVHEYIETKALTVECGAKWKKCPERSATHAEPVEPSAGFTLSAYAHLWRLHRPHFSMPRTRSAWAATRMRGAQASMAPPQR